MFLEQRKLQKLAAAEETVQKSIKLSYADSTAVKQHVNRVDTPEKSLLPKQRVIMPRKRSQDHPY